MYTRTICAVHDETVRPGVVLALGASICRRPEWLMDTKLEIYALAQQAIASRPHHTCPS